MNFIKQIFLLISSFVFVLLIAELFIKNAKISEVSFADYYDDIGKGLAEADTYVFFNEGFGIVSTNSSRFIGDNVALKKDENTIRIALIGDSFVESMQIFERHYFGNIAENILNEKFNQKNINIEILNFGRSNFNIGNMYAYQKLYVDTFNPDYILYFLSNDDLKCDYSFAPLLPITSIENGKLKTSIDKNKEELDSYQKSKFVTQKLALGNLFNFCRRKINNKETLPILLGKFYIKPSKPDMIQNKLNEKYEMDSITQEIIHTMDANTIIINRENEQLPIIFKNLCLANNLTYWELNPTFEVLKKSGIIYNKWNVTNKIGHWNQPTHKAIGENIAKEMSDIFEYKINQRGNK